MRAANGLLEQTIERILILQQAHGHMRDGIKTSVEHCPTREQRLFPRLLGQMAHVHSLAFREQGARRGQMLEILHIDLDGCIMRKLRKNRRIDVCSSGLTAPWLSHCEYSAAARTPSLVIALAGIA